MRWDPTEYDGIETLRVPADNIWKPDIVLYNKCVHLERFTVDFIFVLFFFWGGWFFISKKTTFGFLFYFIIFILYSLFTFQMLSPFLVSPQKNPLSSPLSPCSPIHPLPLPGPGISLYWGIEPSQDQGPLLPLMTD